MDPVKGVEGIATKVRLSPLNACVIPGIYFLEAPKPVLPLVFRSFPPSPRPGQVFCRDLKSACHLVHDLLWGNLELLEEDPQGQLPHPSMAGKSQDDDTKVRWCDPSERSIPRGISAMARGSQESETSRQTNGDALLLTIMMTRQRPDVADAFVDA